MPKRLQKNSAAPAGQFSDLVKILNNHAANEPKRHSPCSKAVGTQRTPGGNCRFYESVDHEILAKIKNRVQYEKQILKKQFHQKVSKPKCQRDSFIEIVINEHKIPNIKKASRIWREKDKIDNFSKIKKQSLQQTIANQREYLEELQEIMRHSESSQFLSQSDENCLSDGEHPVQNGQNSLQILLQDYEKDQIDSRSVQIQPENDKFQDICNIQHNVDIFEPEIDETNPFLPVENETLEPHEFWLDWLKQSEIKFVDAQPFWLAISTYFEKCSNLSELDNAEKKLKLDKLRNELPKSHKNIELSKLNEICKAVARCFKKSFQYKKVNPSSTRRDSNERQLFIMSLDVNYSETSSEMFEENLKDYNENEASNDLAISTIPDTPHFQTYSAVSNTMFSQEEESWRSSGNNHFSQNIRSCQSQETNLHEIIDSNGSTRSITYRNSIRNVNIQQHLSNHQQQ